MYSVLQDYAQTSIVSGEPEFNGAQMSRGAIMERDIECSTYNVSSIWYVGRKCEVPLKSKDEDVMKLRSIANEELAHFTRESGPMKLRSIANEELAHFTRESGPYSSIVLTNSITSSVSPDVWW